MHSLKCRNVFWNWTVGKGKNLKWNDRKCLDYLKQFVRNMGLQTLLEKAWKCRTW